MTGTEVGDEESYYEIEVTLDDGRQVDVQLDESLRRGRHARTRDRLRRLTAARRGLLAPFHQLALAWGPLSSTSSSRYPTQTHLGTEQFRS